MDVTGPFFENHVLGIMALLADTINDGKGPQPSLEKMRCLGAIREMIRIARNHVSNGLPQVSQCHFPPTTKADIYIRYAHAYGLPSKTKISQIKASMRGL